jgi:hypothetical protein
MSAPSRLASSLFLCVFAAALTSACGSSPTSPTYPGAMGHIIIQAALSRDAGAPALGSIVRLNVDVRDASGQSVTNLLTVPVTQADSTLRVELDAPVGEGQEITVLAIGDRPVAGNPNDPEDAGIGVIYRGAVTGVTVNAQSTITRVMTLNSFVPQFAPLETVSTGVRISWTAEPGVQNYLLNRIYDGVGFMTTAVAGSSFVDDTGASRYQIIAVEKGGRHSAPSDFLASGS